MTPLKKHAIKATKELPDDATVDDIRYEVYFISQVVAGLKDAREGRVVSQEDAKKRMKRWVIAPSPE